VEERVQHVLNLKPACWSRSFPDLEETLASEADPEPDEPTPTRRATDVRPASGDDEIDATAGDEDEERGGPMDRPHGLNRAIGRMQRRVRQMNDEPVRPHEKRAVRLTPYQDFLDDF
jgi:hypothetical protein